MSFLSPVAALIAAGIAIPLLVLLYFLKLRRREVTVPSTLLWKRAVQDLQVNSPFQRLRRNLLLLLQLLILAALLIAMARPAMQAASHPGQRVAILIDQSASMNATDVSPTRLDAARRAALDLIDSLASGTLPGQAGAAMIIGFADRAQVLQTPTSDLTLLRAAVRSIQPTDQLGNLDAALRVIEPYAMQAQAEGGQPLIVYIISDGRVRLPEGQAPSLHGADLRYVRIGQTDSPPDNVGIVSFAARRDLDRPHLVQVYARLINTNAAPTRINVMLRLDGQTARVEPVSLPPADDAGPGQQPVQFEFALPGAAVLELSHDHADLLASDNTARLNLAPARRRRVLLVGKSNAFLQRAIRSAGVRELVLMSPDQYENQDPQRLTRAGWRDAPVSSADDGFDVIIFNGYAPKEPPPVNSLFFNAAPPIEGLALKPSNTDEPQTQVVLDWQRDHPLLRHVVLDDVLLTSPGRLAVPPDAVVLAVGPAGPLMAQMQHQGVWHIIISFDILQTNWPLYVSFPVFISNAMDTLGLGGPTDEAGLFYRTGEIAVVPLAGLNDGQVRYTGPAPLEARIRQGQAILPAFPRVGVYKADDDRIDPPFDQIPVNLLDEMESNLTPLDRLEVGAASASGQATTAAIRREIWPWFIWAALAVLLTEWLLYTRRVHL